MPKPKYRIEDIGKNPNEYFVDREECITLFNNAYKALGQDFYQIIMFYGVGGIGKTSLINELSKRINRLDAIWHKLDFENGCEVTSSLIDLRMSLSQKYKIQFPTFDLAYGVYWQKTHPEITLNKNNLSIIEDSEILTSILSYFGHIPIIGLVPLVSKLIQSAASSLKEWWTKNGNIDLLYLPEMPSYKIVEILPAYWAKDFRNYLESKKRTAVFFIDTYEALFGTERSEYVLSTRDEWVRELIGNLPGTLWVISGREKLIWREEACLTYEFLEELPEDDAIKLLQHYGISDENIMARIVQSSCVPYYLILCINTYQEIRKHKEPKVDDFAKIRKEIFTCLIRNLTYSETETLKVLSSARYWDDTLFELLVKQFQTGYPATALSQLCRFSFIYEGNLPGMWYMHQLMRTSLQEYQDKNLMKKVHAFLFKYYNDQLQDLDIKSITDANRAALKEAFYHGQIALGAEEFLSWFSNKEIIFNNSAEWGLLISLYNDIIIFAEQQLGSEHPDVATILNNLADLYNSQGKYNEAEELFKRSLAIREKVFGPEHSDVAGSLNNLADLYNSQGKYNEAEELFKRSLAIWKRIFGPEHTLVATVMNNLAELYRSLGRYDEAEPLYKQSLAIWEKDLGSEHPIVATALNNLSLMYRSEGKYYEAELVLKRSLAIREKVLGSEHPDVAASMNNLASLYKSQGKYDEAEPLYKCSLAIREKVLGSEHPDVAGSLNNLADLYLLLSKYNEAEPLFKRSLAIRERALGNEHPYVATTLNNLVQCQLLNCG
jgi:tetratricopeptide (TPR) repeat protein